MVCAAHHEMSAGQTGDRPSASAPRTAFRYWPALAQFHYRIAVRWHYGYDRRSPNVPAQAPALTRLTTEPEQARLIRIVFNTPTILKLDRRPTLDPIDLASRFFEHSLARAVQGHNCLTGEAGLPWIEAPPVHARIVGHRLFRYKLPRHSYRQGQWLDFDGVVGYLDLKGNFDAGMPYARAAEILHFGQKATFGLGKVRVLVLE
jgi:hypothetical protein